MSGLAFPPRWRAVRKPPRGARQGRRPCRTSPDKGPGTSRAANRSLTGAFLRLEQLADVVYPAIERYGFLVVGLGVGWVAAHGWWLQAARP